jgi:hypothetical protein
MTGNSMISLTVDSGSSTRTWPSALSARTKLEARSRGGMPFVWLVDVVGNRPGYSLCEGRRRRFAKYSISELR